MNLFAYGTLMWTEILADVIGRKVEGVPAILRNARRLRVKEQVYPSIVSAENGEVDGVLYVGLTDPEIAAIDRFEGAEYTRCTVDVQADGQHFRAEVYFASERGRPMLQPEEWTPNQRCCASLPSFRRSYKGWD